MVGFEKDKDETIEDKKIVREEVVRKNNNPKIIISIAFGLVLIMVLVFVITRKSINDKKLLEEQQRLQEQALQQEQGKEEKIEPGITDMYSPSTGENKSGVSKTPDFVKDLNGNKIPTNYTVLEIEEINDLVAYSKYRAVMGNGLEFYWLEAEYKEMPYIIQVPYAIYSKLDDKGYTAVTMEVLTLDNDKTVITNMKVSKSLIDSLR